MDMTGQSANSATPQRNRTLLEQVEEQFNRALVTQVAEVVAKQLIKGKAADKMGWWSEEFCALEDLTQLYDSANAHGDMPAIITYMAMINFRMRISGKPDMREAGEKI